MDYYISKADTDDYMSTRLHATPWEWAEESDKLKALAMATRIINKLNFKGDKTSSNQELEFPRNEDTEIPEGIKYACAEIALKLLDDVDPDLEVESIGMTKSEFSSVKTTYDTAIVREHKAMGIPSPMAWDYLRPYLRDVSSIGCLFR